MHSRFWILEFVIRDKAYQKLNQNHATSNLGHFFLIRETPKNKQFPRRKNFFSLSLSPVRGSEFGHFHTCEATSQSASLQYGPSTSMTHLHASRSSKGRHTSTPALGTLFKSGSIARMAKHIASKLSRSVLHILEASRGQLSET